MRITKDTQKLATDCIGRLLQQATELMLEREERLEIGAISLSGHIDHTTGVEYWHASTRLAFRLAAHACSEDKKPVGWDKV